MYGTVYAIGYFNARKGMKFKHFRLGPANLAYERGWNDAIFDMSHDCL